MDNMDITLVIMLIALLILHIHFCYRALMSKAPIGNAQRFVWSMLSLLMGPLGYYVYQNIIPLEFYE
ncbi:MAG: hypothetical protein V7771_00490 [Shewanella psychromarinicola]|jgi:hypothetical protein|uniref:Cardiolipin synthase N-terminal domain-containing protein n=1 Tax=Shewanella psychromarinicola TaxID=2487742 RepID=A0A3N4DFZ9_9GAMM|nr:MULTISPECIES: hypothetical protein [Shewanella]AZG35891.1 hypothetical protein EGC80_14055 [Shewanella psychromarinicola]MCL1082717.1 hypothetical protein [Shewanella psychromarinicola]PKG77195.1 hypothetical protein CXF80_02060 [Shewanella sp. Actino-trap-3]RPA23752.1 hypothetical protein EGC77_17710 [Shewanella psychromarinicola]